MAPSFPSLISQPPLRAELEVEPAVVDAPGAVGLQVQPVRGVRDQVVQRPRPRLRLMLVIRTRGMRFQPSARAVPLQGCPGAESRLAFSPVGQVALEAPLVDHITAAGDALVVAAEGAQPPGTVASATMVTASEP